jgi:hypothetical protein
MNHAIARLPPLMLDWLGPDYITKDELSQRGYHVPWFPYKVKVIGIRSSGEYIIENDDYFQGILIAVPDRLKKKTKITVGSCIDVYIARIDKSRKLVEAHTERTQRQLSVRRY